MWQPLLGATVLAAVRARVRVRVFGRFPERNGPLLILTNHQHDLDSVVVPGLAMLAPPLQVSVWAVGSQRLFEPGFLAPRVPGLWRTVVKDPRFAQLLLGVGVLPLENEPLARSLVSLAAEVAARHGDLPVSAVLSDAALADLAARAGRPLDGLRLHHLWSPPLVEMHPAPVSLLTLREPHREETRRALRPRLQAQMSAVTGALGRGETVFLTPEGRVTADGRMGRMREALDRLLPGTGGRVHLAAVSYDPFRRRRMSMLCRLVPPTAAADLPRSLAVARPVTVSQLLATWLRAHEGVAFSPAAATAGVRELLAGLPRATWAPQALRAAPDAEVEAALQAMVQLGWLRREGARLARTDRLTDVNLHEAADIFAHQANQMAETVAAAAALQ